MSRICVMCPTRGRPAGAIAAYESMLATSSDTDMILYVDDDEQMLYRAGLGHLNPATDHVGKSSVLKDPSDSRLRVLSGSGLGPTGSLNLIADLYRDYEIYGLFTDDSLFLTPGWDAYLQEKLGSKIPHMVSAHHGKEYVNFHWVNRSWIDAVGFYSCRKTYHYCSDTVAEIIGQCAHCITYATPEEFCVHHDEIVSQNNFRFPNDALQFFNWCLSERRDVVKRVRAAIEAA